MSFDDLAPRLEGHVADRRRLTVDANVNAVPLRPFLDGEDRLVLLPGEEAMSTYYYYYGIMMTAKTAVGLMLFFYMSL